jgi:HlyD family secretion protein
VIERWGGPSVQGRVRRVEPSAFTKVSALGIEEQRVKVVIDIVDPPAAWQSLGDGFRVTVRVITQRVDRARLVPVGALFPHENQFATYVVDGPRARLTPLKVRARNARFGWVDEAPAPGTPVIIYPPANVADGTRVKVRTP